VYTQADYHLVHTTRTQAMLEHSLFN